MATRIPAYPVDKTYGSHVVVPEGALSDVKKILFASQEALHNQGQAYQAIAEKWRLEIAGLRTEGTMLDTRVHELEDQLQGSLAAQQAMQSALQMRERENDTLRAAVKEASEQNHQILAQLEICQRENTQHKKSLEEQESHLVAAARRATTNDLLQKKMQEKAGLEAELKKTNDAMQRERNRITQPVTLGAAVLVGLFTGGVGGFLLGLGGGQLASSVVTESANCPCMTAFHAQLISAQKRLDLVNQEIERLHAEI